MEKSGIDAVRQTFGKRLHTILDARGLPTTGFARSRYIADLIGVTSPTAYKYLSGVFVPGYDILIDLAKRLNVTPDYLIGVGGPNSYLLYDQAGSNPIHMSLPERIKEFSTIGWIGLFFYWNVSAREAINLLQAGDIVVYTTQNLGLQPDRHYIVQYDGLMYIAKLRALEADPSGVSQWEFAFEDDTVIQLAQTDIGVGYAAHQAPQSLSVIGSPVYRLPVGHAFPR
ncbi:hypothetical protein LMG22037_05890 [Paraburkholderia phenoliruptrix]|uniref:HTH cro/C1-type domain-containing protein n=1 Tax=Paraburkholderia phenoliruptrix TaxID=252970 RepID=A0A6J5CDS9_9BURK|nr:helix-turn-helix transcriptional regulator [Paraburkholderia phenoliruptrix]CAB3734639.1 hypothetical protein LMG22037_05890 [Paraburkholderia phenoliruptrix]